MPADALKILLFVEDRFVELFPSLNFENIWIMLGAIPQNKWMSNLEFGWLKNKTKHNNSTVNALLP